MRYLKRNSKGREFHQAGETKQTLSKHLSVPPIPQQLAASDADWAGKGQRLAVCVGGRGGLGGETGMLFLFFHIINRLSCSVHLVLFNNIYKLYVFIHVHSCGEKMNSLNIRMRSQSA